MWISEGIGIHWSKAGQLPKVNLSQLLIVNHTDGASGAWSLRGGLNLRNPHYIAYVMAFGLAAFCIIDRSLTYSVNAS